MAGEWIKLEATTLDKPEVLRIARMLKIDRDAALGKLVRLWSWIDANSVDGVVDGVVDADVDRMCFCPGFAAACVAVGWLVVDESAERITLPNFDRHNGETAKQRALKNRRQANWRAGVDGGVDKPASTKASTGPSTDASTREEKRRDKSNPLTPADAGEVKSKRTKSKVTFPTFVQACRDAGEKPIPPGDPIFTFTADVGIPKEFLELCWREFARKHRDSGRMQKDWRAHFRDAVRRNWFKLWWFPSEGQCDLTTAGVQLKRERDAERAHHEDQAA